jgi:hypothetical protein
MKIIIILGLIIILFANSSFAKNDTDDLLNKLESQSPELQKAGIDEIASQRKEVIDGLIKILKMPKPDPKGPEALPRIAAIRALGLLRATEAVDILGEYLGYPDLHSLAISPTPFTQFPAVGALSMIGVPSLEIVLKQLVNSKEDDYVMSSNAENIILHVLDVKLGRHYLEDALSSEKDPKKKKRILGALDSFNRLYEQMGLDKQN